MILGALTDGLGVVEGLGASVVVLVDVVVWVGVLGDPATGVGVVVVPVLGGAAGVVVVVLVCVGAGEAGVVVVPDGGARPVGGSTASAAPDSGPLNPTAVRPPPARAERSVRRTLKRALLTPDMLGPCSSWFRPIVAFEQDSHTPRAPPDPIHIGREAWVGKGFVIELANKP